MIRQLLEDKELADIEIIDGGTGGVQLLDFFLRHDLVILVDAAMDHQESGTMTRLKPIYSKGTILRQLWCMISALTIF